MKKQEVIDLASRRGLCVYGSVDKIDDEHQS